MLTELGRANVFRVTYRDDATVSWPATTWPIIGPTRRSRSSTTTRLWQGWRRIDKKAVEPSWVTEAIYQAYVPGKVNYGAEIDALQAADIAASFIGGYHTEIALMARAARDRGYPVQLVAANSLRARSLASLPALRPKERSSLMSQTRADAPKRRLWSSGSERQVSSRRVTPCTLMAPFRCGRRRPRKPARWSSRR